MVIDRATIGTFEELVALALNTCRSLLSKKRFKAY
jgi:hypothetical protein